MHTVEVCLSYEKSISLITIAHLCPPTARYILNTPCASLGFGVDEADDQRRLVLHPTHTAPYSTLHQGLAGMQNRCILPPHPWVAPAICPSYAIAYSSIIQVLARHTRTRLRHQIRQTEVAEVRNSAKLSV
jgi:hypothetical protein